MPKSLCFPLQIKNILHNVDNKHNVKKKLCSILKNEVFATQCVIHSSQKRLNHESAALQKIGEFEIPKKSEYKNGQLFIHNVFGYRGVILFPWTVQVFDKDEKTDNESYEFREQEETVQSQIVAKVQTYYQALVDTRDCPHINAQSESVTFLGSTESGRTLYTIPGLDYVSQEDIQPYTTLEDVPLQHDLFDKFFKYKPSSGRLPAPTDTLQTWKDKNHACLELSKVHREVTDGIRITAMPFYLGVKEENNSQEHWWRYCIRIENLMDTTVRLRERHWRIINNGTVNTVRGRGVIGREPILTESQPAFQYSSHVSLHSPNGHMWGIFRMERVDGFQFDARIPAFALESKPAGQRSQNAS